MQAHIDIPSWQVAALFETLVKALDGCVTVDDALLAIALVTCDHDGEIGMDAHSTWHEVAIAIGEEISTTGKSLVQFFRDADVNGDGYLAVDELQEALVTGLPNLHMETWTSEQFAVLLHYIDAQGVPNGRVSLIEFLRALGPRSMAKALVGTLLSEVLKPVYLYRSTLLAFLERYDPISGIVSQNQFQLAIENVVNEQLRCENEEPLTDVQVKSICEIASSGGNDVAFRDFLLSLKVADLCKTSLMTTAALALSRAALKSL